MTDNSGEASCRYEGRVEAGRGCWGAVRGRLVYGNTHNNLSGNYPLDVLHSCQNHREDDLADPDYYTCAMCNLLLPQTSMWTEVICNVCFDRENFHRKDVWIALDAPSVKAINFSSLMDKALVVAQRKNLPPWMKSFGKVDCRIDLTLPAVDDEDELEPVELEFGEEKTAVPPQDIDPENVPLPVFFANNRTRMGDHVHNVKRALVNAHRVSHHRRYTRRICTSVLFFFSVCFSVFHLFFPLSYARVFLALAWSHLSIFFHSDTRHCHLFAAC